MVLPSYLTINHSIIMHGSDNLLRRGAVKESLLKSYVDVNRGKKIELSFMHGACAK